jgi:hypothetical protein
MEVFMADKSGIVSGIFIGIAVTVGSTIATGWVTRIADGSLYKAVGGHVKWTPQSGHAIIQAGNSEPDYVELGDHDMCIVSEIALQEKDGNAGCQFTRPTEKAWTLHAKVYHQAPGLQVECWAMCADIK